MLLTSLRTSSYVLCLVLLSGCLSVPPLTTASGQKIELADTPFHDQTGYYCGPNALATTLHRTGLTIEPAALVEDIYLPARKGSLQIEMVATVRKMQRVAITVEPTLAGIVQELEQGYPVLILQNLGISWLPVWHYAVVIGFDPANGQFVLRSGNNARQTFTAGKLLKTWQRAERWGIVILNPGELPANSNINAYTQAVAALEQVGEFDAALRAYQAGLLRWPQNKVLLLGAGNTNYQLGKFSAAVSSYQQLIQLYPDYWIAQNNLAHTLAQAGCKRQALAVIKQISDRLADPTLRLWLLHAARLLPSQRRNAELTSRNANLRLHPDSR